MPSTPATDEAFLEALQGEDALRAVVRAHIHLEARLQLVLEALTPYPTHLPNLRYEQRVKLAVALGFDERILPALTKLGHIRNALGHRLDVALTGMMVNDLFGSLADTNKQTILDGYKKTNDQFALNLLAFTNLDARQKVI